MKWLVLLCALACALAQSDSDSNVLDTSYGTPETSNTPVATSSATTGLPWNPYFLVPGDQFLGAGFDIAYGSVQPNSVSEVIASFTHPNIFMVTKPTDMDVTPLSAGQLSVSVRETNSVSDVTNAVGADVSLKIGFLFFGFQASASVRSFSQKLITKYSSAYVSKSTVSTHYLRLNRGTLNPQFVREVSLLPDTYAGNEAIFATFIKKWGTHYMKEITLGGKTSFSTFTTRDQEFSFKNSSADIKAGLKVLFLAKVKGNYNNQDTNYQAISTYQLEVEAFGYGGDIGYIEDYGNWSQTVPKNPMPITVKLEPYIYEIQDRGKQGSLKIALENYVRGSLVSDRTLNLYESAGSSVVYNYPANNNINPKWPALTIAKANPTPNAYSIGQFLTDYVNALKQDMSFTCNSSSFITGVNSVYDGNSNDRRWKYYCGEFLQFSQGGSPQRNVLGTTRSNLDFNAPADSAIVGFESQFSPLDKDRMWYAMVSPVAGGSFDPTFSFDSGLSANFGGTISAVCPESSVLTGVYSTYAASSSDRKWGFRCKRLIAASVVNSPKGQFFGYYYFPSQYNKFYTVAEQIPTLFEDIGISAPILTDPSDYSKIWDNGDFAASKIPPIAFWRPLCPLNYFALGHAVTLNITRKPELKDVVCVHQRCVNPCGQGDVLWAIPAKGIALYGKYSVLAGDINVWTFAAVRTDQASTDQPFQCINPRCLRPTMNATAVDAEISTYWIGSPKGDQTPVDTDPLSTANALTVALATVLILFAIFA